MACRIYSYLIKLRLMITFEEADHFRKEHLVQRNLQFVSSFGSFELKKHMNNRFWKLFRLEAEINSVIYSSFLRYVSYPALQSSKKSSPASSSNL
jgi:hypothetical protein